MSERQTKFAEYRNLRGRDGSTTGLVSIPPNKAVECLNVDFYRTSLARKRGGSTSLSTAFSSGGPFTGTIQSAWRHIPGADDTLAELWAVDSAAVVGRLAGAVTFTAPTLKDAITASFHSVNACSFNAKCFMAYKSGQDRLHVWDGSTVRRVGLATPAQLTLANTGSGSYAATLRYYRTAYTVQSAGVTLRRSPVSDYQGITPSGSGASVRITKPAAISEGETHWEIYGGLDTTTMYLIATTVVGTTTYDDSVAPSAYSLNSAMALAGTDTVPSSVKYLLTDGNRLIMAGSWETGGKNNRVWFTPVLGSSGIGDDERIPQTSELSNYIDLDENDGGFITGLAGPYLGVIWVFKNRQIWKLVPTGIDTRPYRAIAESKGPNGIGCIQQQSIVTADDEYGAAALYFVSVRGPYRITSRGIEFLGFDLLDLWPTVNREATRNVVHALYHADLRQLWVWIATSTTVSDPPNKRLVFHTNLGRFDPDSGGIRGGWVLHTGTGLSAYCSTMFANTVAAAMSRDLKPYVGSGTAVNRIYKCDTTATDDNGTTFQGLVTFPDRHFGGLGHVCGIGNPLIVGSVGSHTFSVTMSRDYGLESIPATVSMAAEGAETRTLRKCEAGFMADAKSVGISIGDATASSNSWTLDDVVIPFEVRQPV